MASMRIERGFSGEARLLYFRVADLSHLHCLDVDKLADAFSTELTAVTRALHASERQPRIRGHHGVDESGSRFDLFDETTPFPIVLCPDAAAEPKGVFVRQLNSLVDVPDFEQQGHRTKDFLPVDSRCFGDL